jgi:FKBP-type peptidyl-prolyl cis-trans isomerase FkpA
MNRLLLVGLLFCIGVVACKKDTSVTDLAATQLGIDTNIIRKYITVNNLTSVAKRDQASGEYYIIDTLGTGSALFTSSTLVTVGYTGRVLDSTRVFAQTNNFHPSFALGSVIQGWQIGIPYIKPGGTIRLLIPSGYAYGPYPQTTLGLPANAILDFTIKLYAISN